MVADSQQWKCVVPAPAIAFGVEGCASVRALGPGRGSVAVAEGVVREVSSGHLVLGDGVTFAFVLPPAVELSPLLGSRVKVSLQEQALGGPPAQTLVISDSDGRAKLVARFGPGGQLHEIGTGTRVRAVFSQRPRGPMAFGTDALQYLVQVGEHVRVRGGESEYVVHFAERTAQNCVAYVIAEQSLWVSETP